jgi:hypothetical protein
VALATEGGSRAQTFPQGLKAQSFYSVYVRAEARTFIERVFSQPAKAVPFLRYLLRNRINLA